VFDIYFQIYVFFFKFMIGLAVGFFVILFPFFLLCMYWVFYYLRKGRRFKKKTYFSTYHSRNGFAKLFIDLPRRIVLDWFNRNPDEFGYYGFWLFAGEQGAGKTIAMMEFLRTIKQKYPKCRIRTNIEVSFQDSKIESAEDIVFNDNDYWGQVEAIDEIQNWFNSSESRNFPPELIQEICQERKQHKMIVGTSQCFSRVALPLRQQVNYLCKPLTFAGCLTIVRVYKPRVSEDGKVEKLRRHKTYFFVHDDALRSCYDTREKVKRLSMKGFKPRSEQLTSDSNEQDIFKRKP